VTLHPRHPEPVVGAVRPVRPGAGESLKFEVSSSKPEVALSPTSHFPLPTSNSHGFTLLELLAAMSLMVVVASCLYTALYTGFQAYRTAQTTVDPTSVAINVIDLLKQDICGVLPPGSHLAGAFIGTDYGGI
jgi:prepilin-type N-terminal cleavage/methylation domain-containing protein